jgi:CRISPR/Cas system CSM-associated protein Csm3 (group 7 of RAMP superfamily)
MPEHQKKNRVLHFRVTEADYAEFDEKLKQTGMTASEFFRDVFLNSKITFNVKQAKPVDYHKLVFIYNKAGNNINQLAHKVNADHRRGIISESIHLKWLNKLASIESLLQAGISHGD